jgi:hypothetical protein
VGSREGQDRLYDSPDSIWAYAALLACLRCFRGSRDREAMWVVAGQAGALLDGQRGPAVDPYGDGADAPTTMSCLGFLELNIGRSGGTA